MVRLARIERATYSSGGCHSVQLSYRRKTEDTQIGARTIMVRSAECQYNRAPFGGEGGIRTPGTLRHSGFQDRRFKPLSHLSTLVNAAFSGFALAVCLVLACALNRQAMKDEVIHDRGC